MANSSSLNEVKNCPFPTIVPFHYFLRKYLRESMIFKMYFSCPFHGVQLGILTSKVL